MIRPRNIPKHFFCAGLAIASAVLSATAGTENSVKYRKVVNLPPGDIILAGTKILTDTDSGTIFRGAGDGTTRFTAGIAIDGWKDCGGGVWCAPLPEDENGKSAFAEILFVNGRRAKRCRWPETDFFRVSQASQIEDGKSPSGWIQRLSLPSELAKMMSTVPLEEIPFAQIVAHIKWDVARYPISSYADGVLTAETPEMKSWRVWSTDSFYAVENVRFAFRQPGEWFYDGAAKKVFYRPLPGEEIRTAHFPRDGVETLLAIHGDRAGGRIVRDIAFENVSFSFSSPTPEKGPTRLMPRQAAADVSTAAVVVDDAEDIVFRNCRFEHLGSYALWFRAGCRRGGAFDCVMADLGAGGVRIGMIKRLGESIKDLCSTGAARNVPYVEDAPWMTSHIEVDNCLIAHGGRFHPSGVGVLLTHASDCKITHNDIFDLFYTGISVGWVWGYAGSPSQRNLIGWNHIHDIGQRKLADMGGIYTLGTSFGTRIVGNVIHDIHSYSYGGWGLYNDEGSEGIVMEDNIVWNTDDASYHQHYGKDNVLCNNILLDSAVGQIAVTRGEAHQSFVCERNIIVWREGDAFNRKKYAGIRDETAKIGWSSNLWWCCKGEAPFNGTSFAKWASRVKDKGSVFADPGFRDIDRRDFTLAPDSQALKIGFRPFDWRKAGRRNPH